MLVTPKLLNHCSDNDVQLLLCDGLGASTMLRPMTEALISSEVASVLERHGIDANPSFQVLDGDDLFSVIEPLVGRERLQVHTSALSVARAVRAKRITGVLVGRRSAGVLLSTLANEHQTVGVVVHQPEADESAAAALRSQGVMEIVANLDRPDWIEILRRIIDYRALLVLELQHRCESKRLAERELELLGQPPESMSDDLTPHQPPPLPVGPMSTYNLEEASESFETAYIDRVQQLCASAREAAEYLGVSSATLSRRLRKEAAHGA